MDPPVRPAHHYLCLHCGEEVYGGGDSGLAEYGALLCLNCYWLRYMDNAITNEQFRCSNCGNEEDFDLDADKRVGICLECGAKGLFKEWVFG